MKSLIIAYGNPLRGDDGVGWRVGELLARQAPSEVEVVVCHQLTPELAEPISRSGQVIFVDACTSGEPGNVRQERVVPAPLCATRFSHDVDPAGLLALARQLYGASPPAAIIAVAGERFGYEERLSPRVAAAVPMVVGRVRHLLGQ